MVHFKLTINPTLRIQSFAHKMLTMPLAAQAYEKMIIFREHDKKQ